MKLFSRKWFWWGLLTGFLYAVIGFVLMFACLLFTFSQHAEYISITKEFVSPESPAICLDAIQKPFSWMFTAAFFLTVPLVIGLVSLAGGFLGLLINQIVEKVRQRNDNNTRS